MAGSKLRRGLPEKFPKCLGEMGETVEADIITDFCDGAGMVLQELGRAFESIHADEFVGGVVCEGTQLAMQL